MAGPRSSFTENVQYQAVDYYIYDYEPERNPEAAQVPLSRSNPRFHAPMAGPQQYNFPPPPPPPGPPPPSHLQQQVQYGYQQQQPQYQQVPRGGGPPRGRGGIQGGRGDFHGNQPYNPQQPNGGYNPHGQGPPQGPPAGYNGQQSAPYIGPQAPGPQHQGPAAAGGYGGPQWQNNQHDQHGQQHHGPPQHQPHPQQPMHVPQPAPLQPQNYHPNYAPQAYQPQPPQYGTQQAPPQFQAPQQTPPYGHSGPPNQHGGPPSQWQGPPQHVRPPFNSNNRGRGGFQGVRGGHEAPLMGPPIRMGFDNERGGGGHMAQVGPPFPHHFANHQSPPPAFSPPHYQPYPTQDFSHAGQRQALEPNPYNSGPNRGRGNSNVRGRGGGGGARGDYQHSRGGRGDRDRGDRGDRGDHRNNHHGGNQRATSENRQRSAGADPNGKKKKKRRTNTLGLTPNGVEHEDSEDEVDDADEEARLVTLLGPDTPQLPTNLEEWLAERRSKFPTKARREAAAEEFRQRREQEREARQRNKSEKTIKKEEGESKLEIQQRKAEKLRRELEKAERKIQESMLGSSKRKRENGDEGDDARGQVSDEDSDGSSNSGSEDSKPEADSSRQKGPYRISQPSKSQLQRHCKYYSTGGTCGKKGKCRFVHDVEVRNQALRDKEANGGKMTLAQRLILNDTAKDDLTILKSIKYLKEKGLMSEQLTGARNDEEIKSEENNYAENLHYGEN
ncbi:uncharacterized protein RAG0_00826 [Rhynchosporium agropyri]|uniref:C3H1-type domain-containing protein n=1 Tax=Rhynchosporium agropyri TaxID=914238 RepID=A0A1E1JYR0_9HELO|nr:uncharacterized protein RAG0_00826 [Rhynchosporium agropyri]